MFNLNEFLLEEIKKSKDSRKKINEAIDISFLRNALKELSKVTLSYKVLAPEKIQYNCKPGTTFEEIDSKFDSLYKGMSHTFKQRITFFVKFNKDSVEYNIKPRTGRKFVIIFTPVIINEATTDGAVTVDELEDALQVNEGVITNAKDKNKESKMKITRKQLREMVKESILKETTGAEKAMQSAKIKKDIETTQKTIQSKKHAKQDTKGDQTKIKGLHNQLKKVGEIEPTSPVKKESIVKEDTKSFILNHTLNTVKLVVSKLKKEFPKLKFTIKDGFIRVNGINVADVYAGPGQQFDAKKLESLFRKAINSNKLNEVQESVIKESSVADFLMWWDDEVDQKKREEILTKYLHKSKSLASVPLEKWPKEAHDRLLRYYISAVK